MGLEGEISFGCSFGPSPSDCVADSESVVVAGFAEAPIACQKKVDLVLILKNKD
jgi:hypothetical protein